ncbi:TetR/AcrR family transcriptional regulator [Methylobacillus caricis]|uniref:TetR/AcrR family transcriptional regulator n=1 Tax=Methylobacillus caricis TaxID=1971611 RepID=UPI001CFF5B96|nr:TetR/AcrR family transcriptional regulator [Methylobacillus caricis]MCB5188900.1 TetR/AcrR family transcriptional regulator [Methylobacillus caricis]
MKTSTPSLSTRERILTIARDLILSRGYSAMTIDMICVQGDITKGGFFHYFANKEALGQAVLEKFWHDAGARQQLALAAANSRYDLLTRYLDHAITAYQDPEISQGCMLAIFTMSLAETNPQLFTISQSYFKAWREEMITMLTAASGELALNTFDSVAWGELYITTLEGALLLAKASGDIQVVPRTLGLYKQQLLRAMQG